MTATRLDITLEQGADYDGYFQLDFDPTGCSAAMQIKLAMGYPFALLTLTTQNGGLLIDAANRQVIPVISGDTIAAINAGRYAYDLKMVSPAGRSRRVYEGAAYVSEEVTDIPIFPPSAFGALLLEGGGYFLLENGSRLLLEGGVYKPGALLLEGGGYFLTEDGGRLLLEVGSIAYPGALLLEGGGYFLNETGGKILLEG